MDPNDDFGMVIAQFGRVVIFWLISEVGGQPGLVCIITRVAYKWGL